MKHCRIDRENRIKNGRERRKFMNHRHWKQANEIRQEIKRIDSQLRTGTGLNLRESQRMTSMNQLKRLLGIESKRINLEDLRKVLRYKREEVALRTTCNQLRYQKANSESIKRDIRKDQSRILSQVEMKERIKQNSVERYERNMRTIISQ